MNKYDHNIIAAVILNYNDADRTMLLAEKIASFSMITKVVVVDNHSSDNSRERIAKETYRKIHAIYNENNSGYGAGNHIGIMYAIKEVRATHILVMNPDIYVDESTITEMMKPFAMENCGVSSCIQRDASGHEITGSAWRIPSPFQYSVSTLLLLKRIIRGNSYSLHEYHMNDFLEVGCVAGSLLLISAPAYLDSGGYDEKIFLYCEETSIGVRMKHAEYKTILCCNKHYIHIHSASISKSIESEIDRHFLLIKSHKYVLRNYLKPNRIELLFDTVCCGISYIEVFMKNCLRRVSVRGGNR